MGGYVQLCYVHVSDRVSPLFPACRDPGTHSYGLRSFVLASCFFRVDVCVCVLRSLLMCDALLLLADSIHHRYLSCVLCLCSALSVDA